MTKIILIPLLFLACAGAYRPPTANPTSFIYDIAGTREELFGKVTEILERQGWTLSEADPGLGAIRATQTGPRFSTEECDCGAVYDEPLLTIQGTVLYSELKVAIDNGVIQFDLAFMAEERKRNGKVVRKVECVSLGRYEKYLAGLMAGKTL